MGEFLQEIINYVFLSFGPYIPALLWKIMILDTWYPGFWHWRNISHMLNVNACIRTICNSMYPMKLILRWGYSWTWCILPLMPELCFIMLFEEFKVNFCVVGFNRKVNILFMFKFEKSNKLWTALLLAACVCRSVALPWIRVLNIHCSSQVMGEND